jgi:hypothetical protein
MYQYRFPALISALNVKLIGLMSNHFLNDLKLLASLSAETVKIGKKLELPKRHNCCLFQTIKHKYKKNEQNIYRLSYRKGRPKRARAISR